MSSVGLKKKIGDYIMFLDEAIKAIPFGHIYKGIEQSSLKKVLVREIHKSQLDHENQKILVSEIKQLKNLKVLTGLGFIDTMESQNSYYIVQEYIQF